MSEDIEITPRLQLEETLELEEASLLEEYFQQFSSAEMVRIISRLSNPDQRRIFELLTPEYAASLAELLPTAHQVEVFQYLPPETAADILEEMPSNDRAHAIFWAVWIRVT